MGEIVGTGAFATVHEATDLRLDSVVAIKVLAQNWAADPSVCERFGREATLLRRVRSRHRNAPLAEVFDIDQSDDGRPYFVMSFADRGTLSARITPGVAWSVDDTQRIIDTLTDGLHALHSEGVVHRDIKPSNMLYVSQPSAPAGEELLIGDLGLAKDTFTATSELTVAGGTPGYMAPEQRFPDSKITPAADIFSSTILIAELLTGVRGPESIDHLPVHQQPEFRRGVHDDPRARHGSMLEWRERILAVVTQQNEPTVLPSTPPPPPPPAPQQAQPSPPPSPPPPMAANAFAAAPELDGQAHAADIAVAPKKRSKFLLLLAIVLAGMLTAAGVAYTMLSGPPIDIVGPTTADVGRTIFLSPDLPDDALSHSWLVGGQTVGNNDLRLTPNEAGRIVVELNAVMADGSIESTTHTIDVS